MSSISINIDFLRSWNGICKILQLVLGMVSVGLIGNVFYNSVDSSLTFFLIATSTFFINSSIFFIIYLLSPSAASDIPKTIYELLYHTIASIFLFAGSIAVMVQINQFYYPSHIYYIYEMLLAASIFGLLNTILYVYSAIVGFTTYGDD